MTFRVRSLAPLLVVALAVAACSGTSSASPGTSPPPSASMPEASASAAPPASGSAAICTDAAAFRASVRYLGLLVAVMAITGFIYLLGYTLSKGTSLDGGMPTDSLVVLVGGGSFIVFLAIYLLFIRND